MTPLANSLLSSTQLAAAEPMYPLDLVLSPTSALVQITETVPPEVLFSDYLYFSSFSDAMLSHAAQLAQTVVQTRQLRPDSLVVEVASNDGYLLKNYVAAEIPVLGIEPATNIARVAEERGIRTYNDFFGESVARTLRTKGYYADVIHANNVLAHVADLNGVLEGFRILLKDSGVAIIETPYVKDMIARCEFDTIYHEHLYYFSLTAMDRLAKRHRMVIEDVERLSIHGGSLRVYLAPDVAGRTASVAVTELLTEESTWGVDDIAFYRDFATRVVRLRDDLRELLAELKRDGKTIAAYGAAAKGSTLMNYCGIGTETIEYVVDRSTYKQGKFMPGVHLPIYAPSRVLETMPDYLLVLSWNFADEIMQQQHEYAERGGRFIIPVPHPSIV